MAENYIKKWEELGTKERDWLWRDYIPSFASKVDIANNSLVFALANCWVDAITLYPDSCEEDDEGWIDIDKWNKFFKTHSLADCAEFFLMFNHPEAFDPFGFSGLETQLECLDTVINEIIKEECNSANEDFESKMRLYESNRP